MKEIIDVKNQQPISGFESSNENNFGAEDKSMSFNKKEKNYVILEKGNYDLCAVVSVDNVTKVVEGISFFLVDKRTNLPCIGKNKPMLFKKSKILSAMEHDFLNNLKDFDIEISEQDLKIIMEKSKEFIKDHTKKVDVNDDFSIAEAYQMVIEEARQIAAEDETIAVEDKRVVIKEGCIRIKDTFFPDLTGMVGYSTKQFCDGIRMLQAYRGVKILENTDGRNAWNTTVNKKTVRYYVLKEVNLFGETTKSA